MNIIVDYIKLDLGYCQPDIGAVLVLTFLNRGYTKGLALKGKRSTEGYSKQRNPLCRSNNNGYDVRIRKNR